MGAFLSTPTLKKTLAKRAKANAKVAPRPNAKRKPAF